MKKTGKKGIKKIKAVKRKQAKKRAERKPVEKKAGGKAVKQAETPLAGAWASIVKEFGKKAAPAVEETRKAAEKTVETVKQIAAPAKPAEKEEREEKITTGIDKLLALVNAKKTVKGDEASRFLKVPLSEIEEWGKCLEENGQAEVHYSLFGGLEIRRREK